NEADGMIYFHSNKKGHKVDAMKKHDKICFVCYDEGFKKEGDWALNIKSVIVFGKVEFIEDKDTIVDIMTQLSHKFTDDEAYIAKEMKAAGGTLLFALKPEHMTGKLVNES
ncbi:MAG: pyridoxamine 5'-phosphate oxidase family protein, partial [Firmicutes bacterium]|nr:pyridoxamine 5'-phosphate oxidase family protein [Bacillota bacterium]